MENASESSDVSSKRRLKTPMHLLQDGGVYFLGSKIRIISKAKCRYVVVLVIMVIRTDRITRITRAHGTDRKDKSERTGGTDRSDF